MSPTPAPTVTDAGSADSPADLGDAPAVPAEVDPQLAAAAPRLLDRMREAIRVRHYSIRTEDTYVD